MLLLIGLIYMYIILISCQVNTFLPIRNVIHVLGAKCIAHFPCVERLCSNSYNVFTRTKISKFWHSKVVVCLSVSLKMKPLIWSKGTNVSKCTFLVTSFCICILRQYLYYTQDLSVRFYTLRHIFLSHDHMFRFPYSKCHNDLNSLVRRNPEGRLWIILTINFCLKLVQFTNGDMQNMYN